MIHRQRDSVDYVVVTEKRICEHHKREPWDNSFAGCTCSSSYGTRRATPEEREENIAARNKEQARREQHMRDYDAGKIK